MKRCRNLLSFLIALALLFSIAASAFGASAAASVIRLSKTTGTVQVSKNDEKPAKPVDNMQLYSGHHVMTAEKSNAWINLDSSKLLKEDSLSEVEVRKDGKKLEAHLLSGNLYFNVSESLEDDEDLQIRTSTMVVGIRGTSGWVRAEDRWNSLLGVLEGTVECTVTDPVSGQTKTAEVNGGQKAECRVYPADHAGDKVEIIISDYVIEDIPCFVWRELVQDIPLCDEIRELSGRDILAELAVIAGGDSTGRSPCGRYASNSVQDKVRRICSETMDNLHDEVEAQEEQPNDISKCKIFELKLYVKRDPSPDSEPHRVWISADNREGGYWVDTP